MNWQGGLLAVAVVWTGSAIVYGMLKLTDMFPILGVPLILLLLSLAVFILGSKLG